MVTGVMVDANVLFSRTLRDWLFLLRNATGGDMFTVYATEDVIAETLYQLRRTWPAAPGGTITAIHDRIVAQLDDRIADYDLDGSFPGTDPHDAHVHAAAVSAQARVLLTADSGFLELPEAALDLLPYEVHRPDSFFVLVDDSDPGAVREVTREQMAYWFARDGEVDLGIWLRKAKCPNFARRVAEHIAALDWLPPSC